MPHRLIRTVVAALAATMMASVVTFPLPASARVDDDGARVEGRCAQGIWWRMEAKPDDGRIEVKVEIDTRRTGRRWSWVLSHNGSLSDRGVSRTKDVSGSFEIERTAIDVSGLDTFRLRATRRAVVCVARVSL